MSHYDAVAFDAFGTLCEIRDARFSVRRLARAINGSPTELWQRAMVESTFIEDLVATHGTTVLKAEILALEHDLANFNVFPEALRWIATLRARGVAVGIISNVASPFAALLNRDLAAHVDLCALSCEVGIAKPNPAMFNFLCAGLRLPASRIVMVGDSMGSDIVPARNLGMTAVHVQSRGLNSQLTRLDQALLPLFS